MSGLEIFEDLPDVDVIIAPAGGGSCASGNSIVANHLNPDLVVIAVQSSTSEILWKLPADFVLVTDEEINDAIRLLASQARLVAEGAGAASLAAAIKLRDQLSGKKVVGIVTGGNIPAERFGSVLVR